MTATRAWTSRRGGAFAAACLALGLLAGCDGGQDGAGAQPAAVPPPAVTVAVIEEQEIAEAYEFVGRVEAPRAVDVRARVQGFLQERLFQEGGDVSAGDLLFVIEPDQYEAQLAAARADLSRAQATLREREQALARTRTLVERGTAPEANLDEAIAARDTAAAQVEAAQAAVQAAELNLGYTRIVAPIDGRIGRALISVGNLVGPDAGPLARIVQTDPTRVTFSIGESLYVAISLAVGGDPRVLADEVVPEIRLPTGVMYAQPGRIEFIDPEVDPTTGTIAVRALFPNENALLLPGQFVRVIVRPEEGERLPVVPQPAVQVDREGRYVFVVGEDNTVAQRRITVGARVNQSWAVQEGLQAGETVIVQGVQRVSPGMTVEPVPAEPGV